MKATVSTVPKLPLVRSLAVTLAAIKGRALFCVIQRATPDYAQRLREAFGNRLEDTHYAALAQWHVEPVLGELLTLKGAQSHLARVREQGYEADIIVYSVAEIRAFCVADKGHS